MPSPGSGSPLFSELAVPQPSDFNGSEFPSGEQTLAPPVPPLGPALLWVDHRGKQEGSGLPHTSAFILNADWPPSSLFGALSLTLARVSPHKGEGSAPKRSPSPPSPWCFRMVLSIPGLNRGARGKASPPRAEKASSSDSSLRPKGTSVGWYREQSRALKAAVFLSAECRSVVYQGIVQLDFDVLALFMSPQLENSSSSRDFVPLGTWGREGGLLWPLSLTQAPEALGPRADVLTEVVSVS